MKRLFALLTVCSVLLCACASCGSSGSSDSGSSSKSSSEIGELSGTYFCCDKEGNSYSIYTIEFSGNKFQMKIKAFDYVGGTFETDDDKITLHPDKLTREQLAAMHDEETDDYPESYVDEANERAMGWFDGTYDYNVFDGDLIYISALDPLIQEQDDYNNKTRQTSANSACSGLWRAVISAYTDADSADKLPARTKKNDPIIFCSDASKTFNCDGLNDVLHDDILKYFDRADELDYIVVIGKDDYCDFAACQKKGDKTIGYYPVKGEYNGKDVKGMSLDEIYELVSK